jgi:undecaprenyl-diphosphatase
MKKKIYLSCGLLVAFVLWTLAIQFVDVEPIGPMGSSVGFATINRFFHEFTGVHLSLYVITDWLGLVPVFFGFGFALLGLIQWIRRKNILKVDFSILVLGGFYLVTLAVYLFFEEFVVNYRPVLLNGVLEASYPSSTTMLVMCVIPTAMMQLNHRIKNHFLGQSIACVLIVFIVFMVICRLVSGVHWLTDIIGGGLFSVGLVTLYDVVCKSK